MEAALDALVRREDGPFVVRLPREPGKRELRFAHLFSGEVEETEATESEVLPLHEPSKQSQLEQRVAQLEAEVAEFKALLVRHGLT